MPVEKRDFYYNIVGCISRYAAHNMGNALACLILSLEFLQHSKLSKRDTQLLKRCLHAAERLNKDQETLSMLGGSYNTHFKQLCLQSFFDDLIANLRPHASLQIHVKIAKDCQTMVCDQDRMAIAISNILNNAMQAMPEQGTIGIDVYSHPDLNMYKIIIWDNGPGIDQALHDAVFNEPFSTKEQHFGLGLLMAAMMVEKIHNGRIYFEANQPQGCRFEILIPKENMHMMRVAS